MGHVEVEGSRNCLNSILLLFVLSPTSLCIFLCNLPLNYLPSVVSGNRLNNIVRVLQPILQEKFTVVIPVPDADDLSISGTARKIFFLGAPLFRLSEIIKLWGDIDDETGSTCHAQSFRQSMPMPLFPGSETLKHEKIFSYPSSHVWRRRTLPV